MNLDNSVDAVGEGENRRYRRTSGYCSRGGDWTHDPFKLTREGDYVYSRGDKG